MHQAGSDSCKLNFHPSLLLNRSCLKYSLCSETIPKLLQFDIRIVLCRRWDKRNFRHIYDSDTRGDAHCFNKCITCWMLFIYPILGRMCAAKLPPSTSETGTRQPQSFYYTLKFMTSQIKCLLLTFAQFKRSKSSGEMALQLCQLSITLKPPINLFPLKAVQHIL